MKTKIVVIMPIYKAEKYLRRSIDSVLNQSLKDIKLICVNDASPDNSNEILDKYVKKDDRIVVLNHNKNKGAGEARNTGLDYIYNTLEDNFEYIAFLDADDRLDKVAYEKSYNKAIKTNADILNFNFLPSTHWEYKTEATNKVLEYNGNSIEAILDTEQFYTYVVCWSKLYHRNLLENIRFSKHEFYEDGLFAYKIYARSKKLVVIPDVLYEYNNVNKDSVCSKLDEEKRLRNIFGVINETISYWKNLGILEQYKYKFMNHILLYTSLVCPNILEGNYLVELNNSFGFNVLEKDTMSNISEKTREYISKMTKKQ